MARSLCRSHTFALASCYRTHRSSRASCFRRGRFRRCLAALSCLAVLSANASCRARKFNLRQFTMSAGSLLLALNSVPLAASIITLRWSLLSDNCPVRPGESCDPFAIALDVIGLVSARLARLDLGISLLLTARGPSAWLYGATAGRLGYAEAIPLHRSAGWWCARQAALHSVAYLLFYLETGGLRSLWHDCLPTSNADGQLNRLGLVNFRRPRLRPSAATGAACPATPPQAPLPSVPASASACGRFFVLCCALRPPCCSSRRLASPAGTSVARAADRRRRPAAAPGPHDYFRAPQDRGSS